MELKDKIEQAKRLIKSVCAIHNTALAYSSGKDSVVLDYLARLFDTDPWDILENYFFLDRENVLAGVPKRW